MVERPGPAYVGLMFPTISVTLIGLLVGGALMVVTKSRAATLVAGLVGAWVGFGVGALIGVVLDSLLATGMWVALAGHVLALLGAALAVRLRLAGVAPTGR